MSLSAYLAAIPKAELHVHLEGSIAPKTLLALAARNGVPLPAEDEAGLRDWFRYRDFDHFVRIYQTISSCLRSVEDYETVAYEFGVEMARQNVRYAEITFTPSTHFFRFGVPHEVYLTGLTRGRNRARREFGVEMAWIFDLVHVPENLEVNRRAGDYTLAVALEGREHGVVGLGLAGIEIGHSFERMAPWFEGGRAGGLHVVPHAGETRGPESIWGALRVLGAERIGHGVRAIEDPDLVEYLAESGIPLEVSPTSNVCLGIYPDLNRHPLRRLHDAGVTVTINSDDPPLFNTQLNDEVALLAEPFGLDVGRIEEVLLNGVRHSFLPPGRRAEMERAFRTEMDRLRDVHEMGTR